MATRARFTSASPSPVTGPAYMDNIDGHLEFLYDAAAFPLTAVAGVDTITASLDPDLDGGVLVDGMKFTFTPAGTNTGAVTLNIDGVGAFPVVDADGNAIVAGTFLATSRVLIEYSGGSFYTLSLNAGNAATQADIDQAVSDLAVGATGAPVNDAALHPYDMVTVGDGNLGVIYEFAVDGAVASIESPTIPDGYEAVFFVDRLQNSGGTRNLQMEMYREDDAAYGAVQTVITSFGSNVASSGIGVIELILPRDGAKLHFGRYVSALQDGTFLAANPIFDTTQGGTNTFQKISKVRFTLNGTGNINNGVIHMFLRRETFTG